MREIKFRIWSKKFKKWKGDNLQNKSVLIGVACDNGIMTMNYSIQDDFVVQQFTGLKDENGKEIYEGDIMASRGNYNTDNLDKNGNNLDLYNVVVWNTKMSRFALKPIDEYLADIKNPPNPKLDYPWVVAITCFKEVIGNIFENPDLLNDKKHIDIKEYNEKTRRTF